MNSERQACSQGTCLCISFSLNWINYGPSIILIMIIKKIIMTMRRMMMMIMMMICAVTASATLTSQYMATISRYTQGTNINIEDNYFCEFHPLKNDTNTNWREQKSPNCSCRKKKQPHQQQINARFMLWEWGKFNKRCQSHSWQDVMRYIQLNMTGETLFRLHKTDESNMTQHLRLFK